MDCVKSCAYIFHYTHYFTYVNIELRKILRGFEMDLYERIKEVASAKGISINKLEKDLNLPRSSVRKYSKNKPSAERIGTIADYLGR